MRLIILSTIAFLMGCATSSPPTLLDAISIQEQIESDKFNSKAIQERLEADRLEALLDKH